MSAGLPSDEVVDDYKNSLDDLVTNDRISIGNLTVIAKECIEHAQAIARVLENHILRVSLWKPGNHACSLAKSGLRLPKHSDTMMIGPSSSKIAGLLCSRLDCQKCGNSIYRLLRLEPVSYIYEYFRFG
jgi:hypothetical protein